MKLSDIGDPRRGEAAIEVRPANSREVPHPRAVFVFGVRRGDAAAQRFAAELARACVAADASVAAWVGRGAAGAASALVKAGASVQTTAGTTAMDVDAFVAEQVPGAAGCDVLVGYGADFPARFDARLTVALTAGLPLAGWSPAARSVRDRIDLQLSENRIGVIDRVAAQLLPHD